MWAVVHRDMQELKRLLASGVNVEQKDDSGWTALFWAAGSAPVLEILLKAGARTDHRTREGDTILMVAALKGSHECVQLLLARGVPVDAADNLGVTALHEDVESGDASSVSLLLQHDAAVDARGRDGRTPLMYAAAGSGAIGGVRPMRRPCGC